jgi:hypothetical protein
MPNDCITLRQGQQRAGAEPKYHGAALTRRKPPVVGLVRGGNSFTDPALERRRTIGGRNTLEEWAPWSGATAS